VFVILCAVDSRGVYTTAQPTTIYHKNQI